MPGCITGKVVRKKVDLGYLFPFACYLLYVLRQRLHIFG